jgi:hypothetical protein
MRGAVTDRTDLLAISLARPVAWRRRALLTPIPVLFSEGGRESSTHRDEAILVDLFPVAMISQFRKGEIEPTGYFLYKFVGDLQVSRHLSALPFIDWQR